MKGRRRLRQCIVSIMLTLALVIMMIGILPINTDTVKAADKNYLTFTGESDFKLSVQAVGWDGILEYSTNAVEWNIWDGTEISSTASAPYVLYLRGKNNTKISDYEKSFQLSDKAGCSGNIMTLLDYTKPNNKEVGENAFYCLFYM